MQVQKDLPSFAEQLRLSEQAPDLRMSPQLSPPLHVQTPLPQAKVDFAAAGKLVAAHKIITEREKRSRNINSCRPAAKNQPTQNPMWRQVGVAYATQEKRQPGAAIIS